MAKPPPFAGSESRCEVCEATVKNNKWSHIRAHGEGWYFQRNGRVWCPNHRPPYAPTLIVTEEDVK